MLSDVIERYGGKKMDPLDVYKDIFRIGEGFIQKEYEDSGSFKANPIAYYKNENEDHGHFRIMFEDKFEEIYQNELVNADFCVMNGLTYFGAKLVLHFLCQKGKKNVLLIYALLMFFWG